MNIYLAGQMFIVGMFALIMSGCLALNRALIGRWSVFPLFAFPLLYNYVFLVGLMNYIFGIGVALVGAGRLGGAARAHLARAHSRCRLPAWRCCSSAISRRWAFTASAFCHSNWRGYGSAGASHGRRASPISSPAACRSSPPRRCSWRARPCNSSARTYWDQRGKIDGLMYVIQHYSDIIAFAIIATMVAGIVWAVRHRVLRFHPLVFPLLDRRRRGLFRAAAHHVRHLHDRSARAARRRLHAVRLRRSRVAPPPGAAAASWSC